MNEERLRAEATRVYLRYATEVVEALGLCPWARRARLDGRVGTRVILDRDLAAGDLLPLISEIAADSSMDVGLLIMPRLDHGPRPFRHFLARLRELDSQRRAPARPPLLMADFHPDAQPDTATPQRLVSFIRRTPDPTIQVVRRSALDSARRATDEGTVFDAEVILSALSGGPAKLLQRPVHEQVADANYATVQRFGVERLKAVLNDIRRDRDESYAALGL